MICNHYIRSFKDFVIGLLFTIRSTSHISDDNLLSSSTCKAVE